MPAEPSIRFEALGAAIRKRRDELNLSQGDVAKIARVSRRQITLMEAGGNTTLAYLERVASALDLDEIQLGRGAVLRLAIDTKYLAGLAEESGRLASKIAEALRTARPPRYSATSPVRILLADEEEFVSDLNEALNAQKAVGIERRKGFRGSGRHLVNRHVDAAAGHGAEIIANDEEKRREIPQYYWDLGAREVVKCTGDSLIGRGLAPNDLMFIRPLKGAEPRSNAIVVCSVDDEVFVKIFDRDDDGQILLRSANPIYPDIKVGSEKRLHIFGDVVGRSGHIAEHDLTP